MTNLFSSLPPELDAIDRYLADELTGAERAKVEQVLAENPEMASIVARVGQDIRTSHSIDFDNRRMWFRVQDAMVLDIPAKPAASQSDRLSRDDKTDVALPFAVPRQNGRKAPTWLSRPLRNTVWVAAAVLLCVVGLKFRQISEGAAQSGRWVTYTTAKGEFATIALPDGSTILMNGNSRMEVPLAFFQKNRKVRMSGEAYFTVQSQTSSPFTVEVEHSSIQVLGTQFAVRRYAFDSVTRVAVRNGRVNVDGAIVSGHEQVTIANDGGTQLTQASYESFAFVDRRLVLRGESLLELIPQLNRWYNVDIKLGDSRVGTLHWEATLEAGGPSDLINMLEATLGIRVVRQDRTITLFYGQRQ